MFVGDTRASSLFAGGAQTNSSLAPERRSIGLFYPSVTVSLAAKENCP